MPHFVYFMFILCTYFQQGDKVTWSASINLHGCPHYVQWTLVVVDGPDAIYSPV